VTGNVDFTRLEASGSQAEVLGHGARAFEACWIISAAAMSTTQLIAEDAKPAISRTFAHVLKNCMSTSQMIFSINKSSERRRQIICCVMRNTL